MLRNILLAITCFYSLFFIGHCKLALKKHDKRYGAPSASTNSTIQGKKALRYGDDQDCWITMDASKHFETMEHLEKSYSNTRERYGKEVANETEAFDQQTLEVMLSTRGRIESKGLIYDKIPAGLNLGGYCMMRMPQSVLFFHRMKLRNETRFIIYSLRTDLKAMSIEARLNLRDLHLMGSYERAVEGQDPSELKYVPTYGLIEILLKDVQYSMVGRLRFLHDSPYIVMVSSKLQFSRAMLMHKNNASNYDDPIDIEEHNIEEFLDRMKADLDSWLKDFFNNYLIFFKPSVTRTSIQYREFQKKRTTILNAYVEDALHFLKRRINRFNATAVKLPNFNIVGVNGLEFKMKEGVLRGLDTIYRRSVATGSFVGKVRTVDSVVGFSNLKVVYKYTTQLPNGMPPLNGLLILSADELTAQMYISLVKNPESVDISFDTLQQLKEEALTVEGPANRMISNFKHVLEHHITSIMSNTLLHNVRLLRTLVRCVPTFIGQGEEDSYEDGNETVTIDDGDDNAEAGSNDIKDGKEDKCKNCESDGDYFVRKEDSVELELPRKGEGSRMRMKLQESLSVKKLN